MRQKYSFLLLFFVFSNVAIAQYTNHNISTPPLSYAPGYSSAQLNGDIQRKTTLVNSKLFGNVLYHQDFDGGIPSGWSVGNNAGNNSQWEWDTVYRVGAFSGGIHPINSPTAYNGFMSLTADFFNTPIGQSIPMDTYFESDHITTPILNSVFISYHQYLRHCCSGTNRLVLQVSTDNFITFDEYDATNGLAINASNSNNANGGTTNIINITSSIIGSASFKLRFLAEGMTHYFWMIDDITIIDGLRLQNDLGLRSPYLEFHDTAYTYNPFYTEIPLELFPPLPFSGIITNHGLNTSNSVSLDVNITHDNFPNGLAGLGPVYSNSTISTPNSLTTLESTNIFTSAPWYTPTEKGKYTVNFLANSNNLDQNPGNEMASISFSISDTTLRKYDNTLSSGTGPASFVDMNGVRGGSVGDKYATLFNIYSDTTNSGQNIIPTSVSFFLNNNISNLGTQIVPKIWEYHEDTSLAASFGNEVASSLVPYNINDSNTVITLAFDNGSAVMQGLGNGQYAVGWEVVSLGSNGSIEIYKDNSSQFLQAPVTTFVNFGHNPGWNWVRDVPAIRLNFGNLPNPVGIAPQSIETNNSLFVTPNPNTGIFNLTTRIDNFGQYDLKIRNISGQIIVAKNILINSQYSEQIDLSSFDSGVYFLSIENGVNKVVEKVVVR